MTEHSHVILVLSHVKLRFSCVIPTVSHVLPMVSPIIPMVSHVIRIVPHVNPLVSHVLSSFTCELHTRLHKQVVNPPLTAEHVFDVVSSCVFRVNRSTGRFVH